MTFVIELGPQAKLVSSMWNMDLRDQLEPPRVIKNFPSSDFEWLLKVIKDKTVSEDIRVLCARILSCTFATDLGTSSPSPICEIQMPNSLHRVRFDVLGQVSGLFASPRSHAQA
jgi:hypothetical protein